MQLRDLKDLAASTSDVAFAIDSDGRIVAWNTAAEAFFGITSKDAVGRQCADLVRGCDECGPVCAPNCTILQALRQRQRICNFDLQVDSAQGKRWCNYSVLVASVANSSLPFALYIIRPIDLRKRMEMLVRDFLLIGAGVPAEQTKNLIAMTWAPARPSNSRAERKKSCPCWRRAPAPDRSRHTCTSAPRPSTITCSMSFASSTRIYGSRPFGVPNVQA